MSKLLALFSAACEVSVTEYAKRARRRGTAFLEAQNYVAARRAYRAAIRLDPQQSESFVQLGLAWETDPYGSDERAAKCYRSATRIAPKQPRPWALLARAAVRCGREALALKAVRRATNLAPTDGDVLQLVVDALRELGRLRMAQRIVTQARFLAPQNATIRQLADYVRFETARQQQRRERGYPHSTSAAILPFVRVVREDGESITIRRDDSSTPVPHIARFRKPRA